MYNTAINLKYKFKNLAVVVRVLQATQNLVISRCCFAGGQINVPTIITHVHSHCSVHQFFCLVTFPLLLPSWFRKLPNFIWNWKVAFKTWLEKVLRPIGPTCALNRSRQRNSKVKCQLIFFTWRRHWRSSQSPTCYNGKFFSQVRLWWVISKLYRPQPWNNTLNVIYNLPEFLLSQT